MSHAAILAPSCANRNAVAWPMPAEPPVTMTTLLRRPVSFIPSSEIWPAQAWRSWFSCNYRIYFVGCRFLCNLPQVFAGLPGAVVDFRSYAPATQCLAQFHAQEDAGGVAGDAGVLLVHQPFHHIGIGIDQLRRNGKVIVVNDGVNLARSLLQALACNLPNPFHLFKAYHPVALQVDEEQVLLGIVDKTIFERELQQLAAQTHGLGPEESSVHRNRIPYDRSEFHLADDVLLDVNAGSDFHQFHALLRQAEDAALGDVKHGLSAQACVFAADGDEAPSASQPWPELADVEVTLAISLGQAQDGNIEAPSIIEIELIGLVDDSVSIHARTEIEAARGHSADNTRLRRERE